jgi:hypothetical protein
MEDLRLTKGTKGGYNLIELRTYFKDQLEILDELKSMDHQKQKQFIEFTIKSVDTFIGKKKQKITMNL